MISDANKECLREILGLPHSHQYEKNFVQMLDHGEKLKFSLKAKEKPEPESMESNEKNRDVVANFKWSDSANEENLCSDDESISIDLESVDDFNPTSKVRNFFFFFL